MSEPTNGSVPYRVAYSERVRNELKKLAARARDRGLGADFVSAIKRIDYLLHVYPQFGQPLRDLQLEPAQLWVGVVPPLVVKYVLDEERRLVIVVVPMMPLSRSGL